ncbi:MAG TPA: SIS domain-containing protein [Clostridia bacterium]|nr:SIS domain-containing protein [Clostridia bacterium]
MVLMWEEILEGPNTIKRCMENNRRQLGRIVESIRESGADKIMIAARGTSDHAAVYAKYIMETTLGIPVSLAAPSVFTMYHCRLKLDKTLVIGISQSGKAADVLEVIRSANASGALTVSITNFSDSPLATETRYHLDCSAGLEKSVAATKTFLAQITLLAALTAEWSGNAEMLGKLQSIPDKIEKLISDSGEIAEKVQRYRYMEECFVLARGVNYAIALESALKIQETCYVRAKAYATSDFYHGPYAMIENGMPVFVFAPSGPSLGDVKEMIGRLKESGAELIVISDVEELKAQGDCSFSVPGIGDDVFSPFYNVAIAQMFACRLALAKGLNPDSPRSLSKVTITK